MTDPIKYQIPIDSTRTNSLSSRGNVPATLLENGEGEIILGADGDVLLANDREAAAQYCQFVVKTNKNSSPLFFYLGSRLRDFIGRIGNSVTYAEMEEQLLEDLIDANVAVVQDSVEVLPLKDHTIIINFVIISNSQEEISQTYQFDIMSGAVEDIGGAQI